MSNNPQEFLEQFSQAHKTFLTASQKMGECFLETFGDYVTFGSKHLTTAPKTPQNFMTMCYELTQLQSNACQKASKVILENFNDLKDVAEKNPVTNSVISSVNTFTEKAGKSGGKY